MRKSFFKRKLNESIEGVMVSIFGTTAGIATIIFEIIGLSLMEKR
jgi:hypothetical protein